MLTKYSAEVRSYGVAIPALVLMMLVPLYGLVRRRPTGRSPAGRDGVLRVNLWLFVAASWSGTSVAFVLFVWASIYGIMVVSQPWAFVADSLNVKSGQACFPSSWSAPTLARWPARSRPARRGGAHAVGLIIASSLLLLATLWLIGPERAAVSEGSRAIVAEHGKALPKLLGGIGPRCATATCCWWRGGRPSPDQHHRRVHPGPRRAAAAATRTAASGAD